MNADSVCIFCGVGLTPNSAPEHILLNALGGRRATRRALCSTCNNDLGSTSDRTLAEQFVILRNLLQAESGTGNPPPTVRNVQAGSDRVHLGSDGRPTLKQPPFSIAELKDGTRQITVNFRSADELKRTVRHLSGKLRLDEAQVTQQMTKGVAWSIERRVGKTHLPISLGGTEALRSIVKSCLVLLSTRIGNEALRAAPFAAAREFVLHGDRVFADTRIHIDSRDMPGRHEFTTRFGSFPNLLYVRSNDAGRVVAYCTLFNVVAWGIVLAEADAPPMETVALVSNPLDPAVWCDTVSRLPDIPFEWLDAAPPYAIERARDRFRSLIKYAVERQRETEISRIVDEAFAKHGFTNDQPVTDPVVQEAIIDEIGTRLAAFGVGVPHQQPLSVDEIKRLLDDARHH